MRPLGGEEDGDIEAGDGDGDQALPPVRLPERWSPVPSSPAGRLAMSCTQAMPSRSLDQVATGRPGRSMTVGDALLVLQGNRCRSAPATPDRRRLLMLDRRPLNYRLSKE